MFSDTAVRASESMSIAGTSGALPFRRALRREGDSPRRVKQAAAVFDAIQPQAQQDLREQVGPGGGVCQFGVSDFGRIVKHFGCSGMETPKSYL
jgi:hypothetical protein